MFFHTMLLYLLLPTLVTTFSCANMIIHSCNGPYSFGSLGEVNSYNGSYSCTWTIKIAYDIYGVLNTSSQLSPDDSVTIVYPGGKYTNQLENAYPRNTFWLPEGESKIQFVAKSNGSLSFQLQFLPIDLPSNYYEYYANPAALPESIYMFFLYMFGGVFKSNGTSNSIALGVGGQANNNPPDNPYPLRSCFLFDGNKENRTFNTTFDYIYPNVKLFGTNVFVFCVADIKFYGVLLVQDGEATKKYSEYTVAYVDERSTTLSLMANQSDLVAVTVVVLYDYEHVVMSAVDLSDPSTTMIIRQGGASNSIMDTVTQSNVNVPYNVYTLCGTFSVAKGTAQFSVQSHTNVPDGADCPFGQTLNSSNSPYYFFNGSYPVPYMGYFSCLWKVQIENDMYATVELDGNLGGSADGLNINYPGRYSDPRYISKIYPGEKIYLPPGTSSIQFKVSYGVGGTFQMKITWIRNINKKNLYAIASPTSYPVLFNMSELSDNIIHVNSSDWSSIGTALATSSIDSSILYPFGTCFIFDQLTETFLFTLNQAINSMIYLPESSYYYCVAPINYTTGYLIAANGKVFHSDNYTVNLVTTEQQNISLNGSNNCMTITETSQMHTNVLNMASRLDNVVLTISDEMFSNSVNYTRNTISYPLETHGQIAIFSTTASSVQLTVQGSTKFVPKNITNGGI